MLAAYQGLTATAFRYPTGVAGLRIRNEVGQITLLPFQGQQIWRAELHGRELTMVSTFGEPVATEDYLRTYGGFLIHCGATAMGNPGPADTHPLHGELPNARYQTAALIVRDDDRGPGMALTGAYLHDVAFVHHYIAQPTVTVNAGSGRLRLGMSIRNLRHSPMEIMYLAHINFRPAKGGRILDTVPPEPGTVRRRDGGPASEVVLMLDCASDDGGWAHSAQIHPDGSADFVSHRPDQLDRAVRWTCRTSDEDALGLLLPGTAEADGYTAEKAKGNVRELPGLATFRCDVEFGALRAAEADDFRRRIEAAVLPRVAARGAPVRPRHPD